MPTRKKCSHCGEAKARTEFHRNKAKADGLSHCCKDCQRAYVNQHYQRNRDYYKDKATRRRRSILPRLREIMREAKSRPCADCGKQYPPCAMDFDHVRGKKVDCVSRVVTTRESEAAMRREIAKCEVVCAVCHRLRTERRRKHGKKHKQV